MKNQILHPTEKNAVMKRGFLSCLFIMFFFPLLFSQTTIQIGSGTGTTSGLPIRAYYGYSYSQQIYTASEIQNAGATGLHEISKLRFRISSASINNSTQWDIYIGHTSKNEFSSNSDWEDFGNLTACFTGTVTGPGAGNWMEVTLTTPFQWDGTSNIVVAIDENQPNYTSGGADWYKSDLGNNRSLSYYSDYSNPNPAGPPAANGNYDYVANVQFEVTPAPDCSGTPATVNVLSSNGTNFCEGEGTELTPDNTPFETGITYQWQEFDGTNWNDITGATGTTYTTGNMTNSTDYRVVVGCTISGQDAASNTAAINVNPLPTVAVDVDEIALCSGGDVTINASGAAAYSWSPASGLNNTNTATVIANPSNSTNYTVTGTDVNGCENTAVSSVVAYDDVVGNATVTPSENCGPGNVVNATVSGIPNVASGGTWSYRFLESDGVTEAQTWSTSDAYSFTPMQDSVYTFYYQAENSQCGTVLDSVMYQVVVGFGGNVTAVDYDCNNMGGSVQLTDVFGQVDSVVSYMNAFDAGSSLAEVTMTGNASITDDRLQLTASQTSVSGFAEINPTAFSPGVNNSFTVSFDLTADMPINNYGTGGADGIAYSFGDDATESANGEGQNGKGTKLRLSFDAAGNSSQNGNQPGIYLVYGWTDNDAFGPGSAQTLAYSSNTSLWKTQTDTPVELAINMNGKATVKVNGTVVFDNVDLPAAYLQEDITNWKHLFSARTGGDAMRHAVSNVTIESGTLLYGLSTGGSTVAPTTWQNSGSFDNLTPGTYHVWISKDQSATCAKNIKTIEIENNNPSVNLGNDTTICKGTTLTLDAGNPGSSYVWSNMSAVTQTVDVTTAGAYVVYVTDTDGCTGVGSINVDVTEAPAADGIFMQGTYPNITYSVLNASNTNNYDWDFGDGNTLTNAPGTVTHFYTQDGVMTVTATLHNNCGSTDVSDQFDIVNTVSIDEDEMNAFRIYPNPANSYFEVVLKEQTSATVKVTSIAGKTVYSMRNFTGRTRLDVSTWTPGVYFVQVMDQGISTTQKLVVR